MQEKNTRRTNAERREETVNLLLAAARTLFVEKGYAETGTPEIVKRAQVTRGALYHHFSDKLDLFRAVVRREAEAVASEIEGLTPPDIAPLDAMVAGADAYFDAMAAPGRAYLLLIEGPSVLGRDEMQKLDRETGEGSLRQGLSHLIEHSGADLPLEEMTTLLSAMFDRAALAIADGEDRASYLKAMRRIIGVLSRPN